MKKIILILSLFVTSFSYGQIEMDKALHFKAGYMISMVSYPSSYLFIKPENRNTRKGHVKALIAVNLLNLLVQIGKEIHDNGQPNNKFDIKDVIAGQLGSLAFSFTADLLRPKK